MSKFNKGKKKKGPAISTAALPDIVFMLLFFFMVTTVFKEKDSMLILETPKATEQTELDRNAKQIYYWIGIPKNKNKGTSYRTQVDDAIVNNYYEIRTYLHQRRITDLAGEWDKVINNFKIDEKVNMRTVRKVQDQLREENTLRVAYSVGQEM